MKKISIIISALAVVFCSCSKEQDARLLISNQDTNVVSFKAFFEGEDPETKLGINTSSGVLNWANGDAIAVQMTDDTFVPFTYSSSTKQFSATLGDKEVKDGGVAYYPASIAINGTPGSVKLPTSYTIGADATVCPPMIATVNLGAKALSLKHLGGILSVKVSYVPADANKLVLTVPEKTVTGSFAVTDAADDYISAGTGSSTVTLNFTKGVFGTTAREFFFPVPVTTFSGGFTVDFKNEANETLYTHSTAKTSIEAARASIKRMAELTVPISIYVRNNGTNWTNFMAYYASNTYTTSSWGTNEISDFSTTYTHKGNNYYRFTLPTTETTSTKGLIIFHDSADDAVGRVQLPDITLGGDRYYTISGDGADRMYVKCYKDSWSTLNLYLYDNGYPMKTWPGTSSTNTLAINLDKHQTDFTYWDFPSSIKGDSYDYGIIINDGTNQTDGEWANKVTVSNGYDIVAYISGDTGTYNLIGYGKVATYSLD